MQRRLFTCALCALVLVPVTGCQRTPELDASAFVGRWQSSRLTTPLVLYANGDWEIRTDQGEVLQYGVWSFVPGRFLWTFKHGKQLEHEVNPLVSFSPKAFSLRETDGTVTTFTRLPPKGED